MPNLLFYRKEHSLVLSAARDLKAALCVFNTQSNCSGTRPYQVDIVNSSSRSLVHCPEVDVLHPKSLKLKWIHNEPVVHTVNTQQSRAAQPVVAALPRRAAKLQAHRSFCLCQAIVRTAAVAQGMDWLYLTPLSLPQMLAHSVSCTRSHSFSLWSISPSFFLSSLASVSSFSSSPVPSQTCALLSLFTLFLLHSLYNRGCFIHFVLNLDFLCYLTAGLVASQQLRAHYSPDPFLSAVVTAICQL